MSPITAKVFRAGNSNALRLPTGLKLKAKSYQVTRTATGFVAIDPGAEAKRLKALKTLWGSCPDFPDTDQ
jgi:virulence-associated protein VagC